MLNGMATTSSASVANVAYAQCSLNVFALELKVTSSVEIGSVGRLLGFSASNNYVCDNAMGELLERKRKLPHRRGSVPLFWFSLIEQLIFYWMKCETGRGVYMCRAMHCLAINRQTPNRFWPLFSFIKSTEWLGSGRGETLSAACRTNFVITTTGWSGPAWPGPKTI